MARPLRTLDIWINGNLTGHWHVPARGEMELTYEAAWAKSEEGRPLSLSLPITLDRAPIKGPAVEYYFDNLLPDSDAIRKRVQERFHANSRKPFDLLAAVGRDCVGAVQLLPPGKTPDIYKIEAKSLTPTQIEAHLAGVVSPKSFLTMEEGDSFRLSIAGAQEKTAFLWHEGKWCIPHGATPTSHIFKLPLGRIGNAQIDMSTSVENEWLCSRILTAFNLPVAQTEIGEFGSQKALIVERFDRRLHKSRKYWLRLVQEDFCQATATPSSRKYEENGGPGILDIAGILRGSERRDGDLNFFMKSQILFWMLAAVDGHAKNFSLFLLPEGYFRLTPLYDVLSAWPVIGHGPNKHSWDKSRLAMAIIGKNRHYKLKDIQRRHFNETASRIGIGSAEPLIAELLESTPRVISGVQKEIAKDFPPHVLDTVLTGLEQSAKRLESMPS